MSSILKNLKVLSASATVVVCATMLSAPVAVQATETGVSTTQEERIAARRAARRAARIAARKAARIAARNEPTTVCFYNVVDDLYEQQTLRAVNATRKVNDSDLYTYPMVGDDGVESCMVVEAPGSDCTVVLADGIEYTVADFIAAGTAAPTNASSDSDSCDITVQSADGSDRIIGLFNGLNQNGAGIFFGTGTSFTNPANGTLLNSADDYQECALAVEAAVAQSDVVVNGGDGDFVCPEFVGVTDIDIDVDGSF